jgi:hypothetical protein
MIENQPEIVEVFPIFAVVIVQHGYNLVLRKSIKYFVKDMKYLGDRFPSRLDVVVIVGTTNAVTIVVAATIIIFVVAVVTIVVNGTHAQVRIITTILVNVVFATVSCHYCAVEGEASSWEAAAAERTSGISAAVARGFNEVGLPANNNYIPEASYSAITGGCWMLDAG